MTLKEAFRTIAHANLDKNYLMFFDNVLGRTRFDATITYNRGTVVVTKTAVIFYFNGNHLQTFSKKHVREEHFLFQMSTLSSEEK